MTYLSEQVTLLTVSSKGNATSRPMPIDNNTKNNLGLLLSSKKVLFLERNRNPKAYHSYIRAIKTLSKGR